MNTCPICHKPVSGRECENCGYDLSGDFTVFRTLSPVSAADKELLKTKRELAATKIQPPPPPPKPKWWIAAIPVLALVLLFALGREKKPTPTAEPSAPPATYSPTAAPTPTPEPTPVPTQTVLYPTPGPADAEGCNEGVQLPKSGSWLSDYETRRIKTEKGIRAYYLYRPQTVTGPADVFSYVNENTEVTVLARENGFSFVKVAEGSVGWVDSCDLVGSDSGRAGAAPGPADAEGCNEGVQLPKSGSWLSDYETRRIKTEKGIRAYYLYRPQTVTGPADVFSYVNENTEVTVLARENGFSFVKVTVGAVGWVESDCLR